MMESATVGIDVAKAKLDVVLGWTDGRETYQQVDNTAAGHRRLRAWLGQQGAEPPLRVCLEATGRYGQAIALHLYQSGYRVSVVKPAQVKHFGAALAWRHKTDKADAAGLARYAAPMTPPAWPPPTYVRSQLQDLKRLSAGGSYPRQKPLGGFTRRLSSTCLPARAIGAP